MIKLLTDNEIRSEVEEQIAWDSRVRSADVKVVIENGKVHLRGTVPSLSVRSAVEEDVWQVKNVQNIVNELQIGFPQGTRSVPSDVEIHKRINQVFAVDPDLYQSRFQVEVRSGVVTVKGKVNSYFEKFSAERVAYRVYGVKSVENQVQVVPSEPVEDNVITNRIRKAFNRIAYADAVNFSVKNGVVTVDGSVPQFPSYNAVIDAVRYTNGVVDVRNNLMVRNPENKGFR